MLGDMAFQTRDSVSVDQLTSNNVVATGTLTSSGGVVATNTNPFFYSATTVSANVTVPTGFNALAAGPITVANSVVVTVPDGSTLTVV